jgi:hypothetical protein
MYVLKRTRTGGGFNVKPNKRGGFQKLMRNKVAGYGMGREVMDNIDKGIKNNIGHLTQKMSHLSIKSSKPRKYISLNL